QRLSVAARRVTRTARSLADKVDKFLTARVSFLLQVQGGGHEEHNGSESQRDARCDRESATDAHRRTTCGGAASCERTREARRNVACAPVYAPDEARRGRFHRRSPRAQRRRQGTQI